MQFFLHVGVITTCLIYAGLSYFIVCVVSGCIDRYKEHNGDYRYDLNAKSRALSFVYLAVAITIFLIDLWLGWLLIEQLGQVN
ncbi:hypothetical protein D3C75_909600 [compost metagenome]